MILASHPAYVGFDRFQRLVEQGRVPVVTINGARMPDVIAANDRSGRAIVLLRGPDGCLVLGSNGQPLVVAIDGVVQITIPPLPLAEPEPDGFA